MTCYYCNREVKEAKPYKVLLTKKRKNSPQDFKEIQLQRCKRCSILHKMHMPFSIIVGTFFVIPVYYYHSNFNWVMLFTFLILFIALSFQVFNYLYKFAGIKAEDDVEFNVEIKELMSNGWEIIDMYKS